MLKNLFRLVAVSSFLVLTGCVTKPTTSVSGIMQQPDGTRYYLAHNIWVKNPSKISSINYQSGSLLPVGTEIADVKILRRKRISFRAVSTGITYTIVYYEKYALKPLEEYLKTLITTKNREEILKDVPEKFADAVLAGKVLPGMSKNEVILTYGPPSPHRTPSLDNPTWIYWLKRWPVSLTSRVIFKDGKVLEVMH